MRNEIAKTYDQIEGIFEAVGHGLTVDDLEFTRDTFEDFSEARKSWRNPGRVVTNKDSILEIEGAQVRKGEPRQAIVVADFGTVRAVYRA